MKECSKILIEIVTLFEEYEWEYVITLNGHIQIELGNEFYDVDKTNLNELKELLEEVKSW